MDTARGAGMTPYYEHGGITIFHGDCREILPQLEPVDLVLTDPPYPGLVGGHDRNAPGGVSKRYAVTQSVGREWDISFDDWWQLVEGRAIYGLQVFCSHHSVALIRNATTCRPVTLAVWYRRNSTPTGKNLPRYTTEYIWWLNKAAGLSWDAFSTTLFDVPMPQSGCFRTERFVDRDGATVHPTQKPLTLIRQLLACGGQTVLDPFMGTGTTLRAAKDLGRRAIGIEIEEKYCEIAAERLRQEVLFT